MHCLGFISDGRRKVPSMLAKKEEMKKNGSRRIRILEAAMSESNQSALQSESSLRETSLH